MKKFFITLLALMLALCALAAAEGVSETEIPTIELGEMEIDYEKNWVELDGGRKLCVPADWTALELSDDMLTNGLLYAAQDAEKTLVAGLAFAEIGITDTESLASALRSSFSDVSILSGNGAELIAYDAADGAYAGLALLDGKGGMYTLTLSPIPDESIERTAILMLATLELPETEE